MKLLMEQEDFKKLLRMLISEANNEEINTVNELIERIVIEIEMVLAPSYA